MVTQAGAPERSSSQPERFSAEKEDVKIAKRQLKYQLDGLSQSVKMNGPNVAEMKIGCENSAQILPT